MLNLKSGVDSRLHFAYTRVQDLVFMGGGSLPCRNDYIVTVMPFYMQKIRQILYVMYFTCSTIVKSPILHVHCLQNL